MVQDQFSPDRCTLKFLSVKKTKRDLDNNWKKISVKDILVPPSDTLEFFENVGKPILYQKQTLGIPSLTTPKFAIKLA